MSKHCKSLARKPVTLCRHFLRLHAKSRTDTGERRDWEKPSYWCFHQWRPFSLEELIGGRVEAESLLTCPQCSRPGCWKLQLQLRAAQVKLNTELWSWRRFHLINAARSVGQEVSFVNADPGAAHMHKQTMMWTLGSRLEGLCTDCPNATDANETTVSRHWWR